MLLKLGMEVTNGEDTPSVWVSALQEDTHLTIFPPTQRKHISAFLSDFTQELKFRPWTHFFHILK